MTLRADLAGRAALVTGAARGIGAAIGRRLAENGARVAFTDLDEAGARVEAAAHPGCLALAMDVRDEAAIDRAVGAALDAFGRLDILVNNAGVNTLAHRVDVDAFPLAEWRRILDIDLDGLFLVSRRAVPAMRAVGAGRVINVASVVGLVPLRLQSAFVAAKAGVVNLTRSMALELGPAGILVNAIAPGSTLTEGTRALFYGEDGRFSDRVGRLLAHIPLGRPATTDEIADAALFLACPASSYVTGHVLAVDGGWTAGFNH